tara:strand:+ start:520 stop:924 length:405 start_codon:yes stop_codon:yes gene_type:complete
MAVGVKTIEGTIYEGQIAKKVTLGDTGGGSGAVTNLDIKVDTQTPPNSAIFTSQRQKQLTVAIRNNSSTAIDDVKIVRVFQDGTESVESTSAGPFGDGDGPTFVFSYNVPKFFVRLDAAGATNFFIEVDNGGVS